MKLKKIDEVETVRIHFLSDFLICRHPKILLPWQRDVTTSPLYSLISLTVVNTICYSLTLYVPRVTNINFLIHTSSRQNVMRINKMITGEKNDKHILNR